MVKGFTRDGRGTLARVQIGVLKRLMRSRLGLRLGAGIRRRGPHRRQVPWLSGRGNATAQGQQEDQDEGDLGDGDLGETAAETTHHAPAAGPIPGGHRLS